MPAIGTPELIIILVIVLIIFGVGRLPQVGRSIGQGIREFRESLSLLNNEENQPLGEKNARPPKS